MNENAIYFEAPKEDQQKHIKRLWEMVEKCSSVEDASEDERWRMSGLRLQAAIVARVSGVMDRDTFCAETSRYTQIFASAVGGVAFSSEPPSEVSPELPSDLKDWIVDEADEFRKNHGDPHD